MQVSKAASIWIDYHRAHSPKMVRGYKPIMDQFYVDEIIFRTTMTRNRLILELMVGGGMQIGEVLKLR